MKTSTHILYVLRRNATLLGKYVKWYAVEFYNLLARPLRWQEVSHFPKLVPTIYEYGTRTELLEYASKVYATKRKRP